MSLYIGCPIWSFKGWVGNFYPAGTKSSEFLREYARRLTSIEGNTTFYAVPAQKMLETWIAQTPATFRFCPKIPKAISHEGRLVDGIPRALGFIKGDGSARTASGADVPAIATTLLAAVLR